ncbi:DUF6059 family protein [Kitasatospora sp. NPDC051170]|uniref:DUF6059 family protein n=1 Tax=Kitasatospora sp. NPDC051170 TaxID=3364056 RepID=UPI00379413EF
MDVPQFRPALRHRAGAWALRHLLLPMRWLTLVWAPMPGCDGTEWTPPLRSPCTGPPAGHPERLVAGVPPTPVERELWARLGRPT